MTPYRFYVLGNTSLTDVKAMSIKRDVIFRGIFFFLINDAFTSAVFN